MTNTEKSIFCAISPIFFESNSTVVRQEGPESNSFIVIPLYRFTLISFEARRFTTIAGYIACSNFPKTVSVHAAKSVPTWNINYVNFIYAMTKILIMIFLRKMLLLNKK